MKTDDFASLKQMASKAKVYSLLNTSEKTLQDVYSNPHAYDIAYPGFKGDVEFYCSILNRTGPVLYVGIGSGRIFGELSKLNPDIIGLDKSSEMLGKLMEKFPTTKEENLIFSDIIDFNEGQFDQIIAPYAFLNAFTPEELKKVLASIANSLTPNGQFITDIFSPYNNPPFHKNSEIFRNVTDEDGNKILMEIFYDHVTQRLLEITYTKEKSGIETLITLKNFTYYPNEIVREFEATGLSTEVYGGYGLEEPTEHCEPFVIMAKKGVE